MPELAEVEWYRKQWNAGIGQVIDAVQLHSKKRIFRGTSTRDLQRRLAGEQLLSSQARGKRMVFRFSGDNWLGIHLGMTGTLRTEPPGFRAAKHDHLVLHQRDLALVFRDSRQFGRVRFHHGSDAPEWWDTSVPEIVTRQFDQKWLDQMLRRHGRAPVKGVLLMQHAFSGIGNWMADEILWRAKLLPSRRANSLGAEERIRLLRETKFVARRSLETLGVDDTDLPPSWLIHQRWKRGGKCPKHGGLLRRATIGGRTTAWCSKCQT